MVLSVRKCVTHEYSKDLSTSTTAWYWTGLFFFLLCISNSSLILWNYYGLWGNYIGTLYRNLHTGSALHFFPSFLFWLDTVRLIYLLLVSTPKVVWKMNEKAVHLVYVYYTLYCISDASSLSLIMMCSSGLKRNQSFVLYFIPDMPAPAHSALNASSQ